MGNKKSFLFGVEFGTLLPTYSWLTSLFSTNVYVNNDGFFGSDVSDGRSDGHLGNVKVCVFVFVSRTESLES